MTHLIDLSNLVFSLMSPLALSLSLSLFLKVRCYTDNSYIIRSVKVCIKDWTLYFTFHGSCRSKNQKFQFCLLTCE